MTGRDRLGSTVVHGGSVDTIECFAENLKATNLKRKLRREVEMFSINSGVEVKVGWWTLNFGKPFARLILACGTRLAAWRAAVRCTPLPCAVTASAPRSTLDY